MLGLSREFRGSSEGGHFQSCIDLVGLCPVLLIEILFFAVKPTASCDSFRIPSTQLLLTEPSKWNFALLRLERLLPLLRR